jgi:E3 ubiquitin-protein ligase HERC2
LKVSLLSLQIPAVAFSVTNLPFTEPMLSVWAQLVNLAGSKLEKHKIKKSPKQAFAGQYVLFLGETAISLN